MIHKKSKVPIMADHPIILWLDNLGLFYPLIGDMTSSSS